MVTRRRPRAHEDVLNAGHRAEDDIGGGRIPAHVGRLDGTTDRRLFAHATNLRGRSRRPGAGLAFRQDERVVGGGDDGSGLPGSGGHDPVPRICARCSTASSTRRPGSSSGARPPPSTTTRPTRTACSSTRLTVAQGVSALASTFGGIDRDVAVAGALMHDIGKLEAYATGAGRHRDDRPRQAPGRDPARLLPRPSRDRGAPRLPRADGHRRCCTSSSPTTEPSSTARRSCRARARRRSCT